MAFVSTPGVGATGTGGFLAGLGGGLSNLLGSMKENPELNI